MEPIPVMNDDNVIKILMHCNYDVDSLLDISSNSRIIRDVFRQTYISRPFHIDIESYRRANNLHIIPQIIRNFAGFPRELEVTFSIPQQNTIAMILLICHCHSTVKLTLNDVCDLRIEDINAGVTAEGAENDLFQNIKTLALCGCDESIEELLSDCQQLRELIISHSKVTGSFLEYVFPELRKFHLTQRMNFNIDIINGLSHFFENHQGLIDIELDTKFVDSLEMLLKLPNLKHLTIFDESEDPSNILNPLANLQNLESLCLETDLPIISIFNRMTSMESLEKLEIRSTGSHEHEFLETLMRFTNLKFLSINGDYFDDTHLEIISKNKNLRSLEFTKFEFMTSDALINLIAELKHLEKFTILQEVFFFKLKESTYDRICEIRQGRELILSPAYDEEPLNYDLLIVEV